MTTSTQSSPSSLSHQRWYNPTAKLNRLAVETSPYLLGHADNPVDWYPWGEEALQRARVENKPIFLSIGYSACHWCHVMEHECFEDASIAQELNKHFVCIKVDREQRPDLDHIYMAAVQAFTHGGGGWPMSVFLTPDCRPFFAGTYFPPTDNPRQGIPGFMSLIREIARVFRENSEGLNEQADILTDAVRKQLAPSAERVTLSEEHFFRAIHESVNGMDFVHGGWGEGRKFPHVADLNALMRAYATRPEDSLRLALEKTFDAMINGGLYDHVGGGFHRYTVDRQWTVPHFEKMLYDSALLVTLYADAFTLFRKREYQETITGTLDFLLREMNDSGGAFYSALDADSDGEEGVYYVWTAPEIESILGESETIFCDYYNVTSVGNFDGNTTVLTRNLAAFQALDTRSDRNAVLALLSSGREKLLHARAKRNRPLTDDKIIAAWNGMALSAFCRGYQITADPRYLAAALKLGAFLRDEMFDGTILRHVRRGTAMSKGVFLEDYAFVAYGMIDLYETCFDLQWLDFARRLVSDGFASFSDDEGNLYLTTAGNAEHLARPADIFDSSYPSAGAYLLLANQRLAGFERDNALSGAAEKTLFALSGSLEKYARSMMATAWALFNQSASRVEIAIIGADPARQEMLVALYGRFLPQRVVASSITSAERPTLLHNRLVIDTGASAFICKNSVCGVPARTLAEFIHQLETLSATQSNSAIEHS